MPSDAVFGSSAEKEQDTIHKEEEVKIESPKAEAPEQNHLISSTIDDDNLQAKLKYYKLLEAQNLMDDELKRRINESS